MSNGKAKQVVDQKPKRGSPAKDGNGRNLVAEEVTYSPSEKTAKATVSGLVVEAVDDDGAGLARVLSTLAAMAPG